jgi:hypothetical protein
MGYALSTLGVENSPPALHTAQQGHAAFIVFKFFGMEQNSIRNPAGGHAC